MSCNNFSIVKTHYFFAPHLCLLRIRIHNEYALLMGKVLLDIYSLL